MKINLISFLFAVFMLMGFSMVYGQQMVYKPVNPNFGGNPLNYSGLMASAEAQNQFKEENSFGLLNQSPLSQFSESIKRQILSELTGDLLGKDESGKADLETGTTEVGGLVIDVVETRSGSVITIIDTETGESTQIAL